MNLAMGLDLPRSFQQRQGEQQLSALFVCSSILNDE
jgi:hypothetical protein